MKMNKISNDKEHIFIDDSNNSSPFESDQFFQVVFQLIICIAPIPIGYQFFDTCDGTKLVDIYLIIHGIFGIALLLLRYSTVNIV